MRQRIPVKSVPAYTPTSLHRLERATQTRFINTYTSAGCGASTSYTEKYTRARSQYETRDCSRQQATATGSAWTIETETHLGLFHTPDAHEHALPLETDLPQPIPPHQLPTGIDTLRVPPVQQDTEENNEVDDNDIETDDDDGEDVEEAEQPQLYQPAQETLYHLVMECTEVEQVRDKFWDMFLDAESQVRTL
jgi:hypothetical protein